jgi:hypothetical protein
MKEEIFLDYEEFVLGTNDQTVRLEILPATKENKEIGFFEKGSFSAVTNKIFAFFTFAPIFAIPIICYLENNWVLLLGFLGIFLGMFLTGIVLRTNNLGKEFVKSIFAFSILPAALIYLLGVFNVLTFITICFYYEHLSTMLSNLVFEILVKKNLLKDPNSYYGATIAGRIKTYRIS